MRCFPSGVRAASDHNTRTPEHEHLITGPAGLIIANDVNMSGAKADKLLGESNYNYKLCGKELTAINLLSGMVDRITDSNRNQTWILILVKFNGLVESQQSPEAFWLIGMLVHL